MLQGEGELGEVFQIADSSMQCRGLGEHYVFLCVRRNFSNLSLPPSFRVKEKLFHANFIKLKLYYFYATLN